jgi:hypothetical protein
MDKSGGFYLIKESNKKISLVNKKPDPNKYKSTGEKQCNLPVYVPKGQ